MLISNKEKEDLVHKETTEFLKRKKEKIKSDIDHWKIKIETDMEVIDEDLRGATQVRETDLEHLNRLKARREADIATEKAHVAAIQHEKELARLVKIEGKRQTIAVRKISNTYLNYKAEKAKALKKSKAGGKKGKGKKGKKK